MGRRGKWESQLTWDDAGSRNLPSLLNLVELPHVDVDLHLLVLQALDHILVVDVIGSVQLARQLARLCNTSRVMNLARVV